MSGLTLNSHFSSAHLYHQPLWDEQKNREVFGRCFTKYGHGHNYILEATFEISIGELQMQVQEKQKLLDGLTKVLDHEHLNFVIAEFKDKIPTTENILLYFAEKLKHEKILNMKVFENPHLWAEQNFPDNIKGSP